MKEKCPWTHRSFYENVFHHDLGKLIPTYVNRDKKVISHSYTIPKLLPNGEGYIMQSYDHVYEVWQEPIILHAEQLLISLLVNIKESGDLDNEDFIESINFVEKQYM